MKNRPPLLVMSHFILLITLLLTSVSREAPAEVIRKIEPLSVRGVNYYPRHTPWSKMWTETPAEVWEQDMAAAAKLGVNTVRTLKGDTEDCWVKDIVMRETLNNVQVWGGCRRITITGAHSYHNSTVEKGAGYAADISIRGSQVLVDRCSSHRLGGFYVATLNQAAMLNVVLNCTFEGDGSIQPHMHWSTVLLIDSCTIPDGRIDLINRHSSGSGHGWAIG